jgi:hypothetical protein
MLQCLESDQWLAELLPAAQVLASQLEDDFHRAQPFRHARENEPVNRLIQHFERFMSS